MTTRKVPLKHTKNLIRRMNADQFIKCLHAIVHPGTPFALTWGSENNYPVRVVSLQDSDVVFWIAESVEVDGLRQPQLPAKWIREEGNLPEHKQLADLFNQQPICRVYRIDSGRPSEIELYLLARMESGEWIGIKTTLIES